MELKYYLKWLMLTYAVKNENRGVDNDFIKKSKKKGV